MKTRTEKLRYKGNVKNFDRRSIPGMLLGAAALNTARNFLKFFALGALALWLFAKPFKKLTDAAYAEPLKAIGWGFVLVAIGFMAVILFPLVFVMVGILLGFISLGSLLFFWFGIQAQFFCWRSCCSSSQCSR